MANNPFRPIMGLEPKVWMGRDSIITNFELALYEGAGSPYRTLLLSGTRGSGKTVLLERLESAAEAAGWMTLPTKRMPTLLEDYLKPEIPVDGQFRRSLTATFRQLFEGIQGQARGVVIIMDGLHSVPTEHVVAIVLMVKELVREGYDIAFVAAGLASAVEMVVDQPGASSLQDITCVELGPVSDAEVKEAFVATAAEGGRTVAEEALEPAVKLIHGLPYLLQLVGSKSCAFSIGRGSTVIEAVDVEKARGAVIGQMGTQIHFSALYDITDGEFSYLMAMVSVAQEAGTPVEISAIAERLGKPATQLSRIRRKLIERDIVFAPQRGVLDFRLPYLGEYLLQLR